jgi:hypothetical protein
MMTPLARSPRGDRNAVLAPAPRADVRKVHEKPRDCHEIVTDYGLFAGSNCFLCDLREGPSLRLVWTCERCFDGSAGPSIETAAKRRGVSAVDQAEQTTGETAGAEGQLRGLLLPHEPALRAGAQRALFDIPSQRGPTAPATAAAVRIPSGAPLTGGLGISLRPRAGGAAHVVLAVRGRHMCRPAGECMHSPEQGRMRPC